MLCRRYEDEDRKQDFSKSGQISDQQQQMIYAQKLRHFVLERQRGTNGWNRKIEKRSLFLQILLNNVLGLI